MWWGVGEGAVCRISVGNRFDGHWGELELDVGEYPGNCQLDPPFPFNALCQQKLSLIPYSITYRSFFVCLSFALCCFFYSSMRFHNMHAGIVTGMVL